MSIDEFLELCEEHQVLDFELDNPDLSTQEIVEIGIEKFALKGRLFTRNGDDVVEA